MIEDSRKKIFIISGVIVGLIIVAILFWFFYHPAKKEGSSAKTQQVKQEQQAVANSNDTAVPAVEKKAEEAKQVVSANDFYVQQLARIFTERFFSFSNQNQNQHIADALALSSASMASWIQKQALEQSATYQGVSTAVVASSVKSLDSDKATVMVDVQRIFEGVEAKKEYKTGRVELVKENEVWKVKGFYWEK